MAPDKDPSQRWDPTVTPTHPKFTSQVSIFRLLLSPTTTSTLDDILSDYFTPNERLLVLPATSPPHLVEIQSTNTRRYRRLLRGRFAGVGDDAATRLAMLYFGLPAEPLTSGMVRAVDSDVEMLDGEGARLYKVVPPLHSLTAHDHRNWRQGELRGTEAPLSYMPVSASHVEALETGRDPEVAYDASAEASGVDDDRGEDAIPLPRSSFRGGAEDDDDDDDDDGEGEDEETSDQDQSSSHSHSDSDIPQLDTLFTHLMHSYQGTVPFSSHPTSVISAIRRLLDIDRDDRPDIVITHLSKRGLDGLEDPVRGEMRVTCPPSNLTLANIKAHLDSGAAGHRECCTWFVRYADEPRPRVWLPTAEETQDMVVFEGRGSLAQSRALLHIPEAAGPDFATRCGSNIYKTYLRTAMHTILGPHDPGEDHFAAVVYDDDTVRFEDAKRCYAGLIPPGQLCGKLYRTVGRAEPWRVKKESLRDDAIALVLPGYDEVPQAHRNGQPKAGRDYELVDAGPGDAELAHHPSLRGLRFPAAFAVVEKMLQAFIPVTVTSEFIRVNIGSFHDILDSDAERGTEHMYHSFGINPLEMRPKSLDKRSKPPHWARPLAEFLERRLKETKLRHAVLHVGQNTGYSLVARWAVPEGVHPLDITDSRRKLPELDLDHFRRAVSKMAEQYPHPVIKNKVDHSKVYISLEEVISECGRPAKVVISPDMTKEDFQSTFKYLSGLNFAVTLSYDEGVDFARTMDSSMQWGPRYGDVEFFEYDERYQGDPSKRCTPPAPTKPAETHADGQRVTHDVNVRQPSLFDTGPYPTIPTSAPPREPLLRTGGPSVPMVSKRVITPTEQQRLQEALHTTRNIKLGRAVRCNYRGCDFTARASDVDGMQRHLQQVHVADRCPWCPTELFAHMSADGKERHLMRKHADKLLRLVEKINNGALRELGPRTSPSSAQRRKAEQAAKRRADVNRPQPVMNPPVPKAPKKAAAQEKDYRFCDRCGRDHRELSNEADREWHDHHCVPRAPHNGDLSWCSSCGGMKWRTPELSHRHEGDNVEWPHQCGPAQKDPRGPLCTLCGIAKSTLGNDFTSHVKHCRGFSGKVAQFCPYCRIRLDHFRDHNMRGKHIRACKPYNPWNGEDAADGTPYSMYPRRMWEDAVPRPEDDLFYTGWCADLQPMVWEPPGADAGIHIDGVTYHDQASDVRAEEEVKRRAREVLEQARSQASSLRSRPSEAPGRSGSEASTPVTAGTKRSVGETGEQRLRKRRRTEPEDISSSDSQIPPRPRNASPQRASSGRENAACKAKGGVKKAQKRAWFASDVVGVQAPAIGQAAPVGQSERPEAPEQNEVTGPEDPNFKIETGMFCSRCFRLVPAGIKNDPKSGPTWAQQWEAHMDPNGRCRIRRGRGNTGTDPATGCVGLPNRSGWLKDSDFAGTKDSRNKIKKAFREEYPSYAATMYPVTGTATSSVWKLDPNNEANGVDKLPWPPIKGRMQVEKEPVDEAETRDAASEADDEREAADSPGDEEDEPEPPAPNQTTSVTREGTKITIKIRKNKIKDRTYRDQRGEAHSEDEEPEPEAVRADAREERRPVKAPASGTVGAGGLMQGKRKRQATKIVLKGSSAASVAAPGSGASETPAVSEAAGIAAAAETQGAEDDGAPKPKRARTTRAAAKKAGKT